MSEIHSEVHGKRKEINGLIAATFTPFTNEGNVDLAKIPAYVDHLHQNGVKGVFVNGTTGEGPSLSVEERKKMAEAWREHSTGKLEHVIIQVGCASLQDAKHLAEHASSIGADGVACLPPFFLKNIPLDGIIRFLKEVADSCPKLPFYFYHIPMMTAVDHSAVDIMRAAGAVIPNLAGLKHTSYDLKEACTIANMENGRFQVLGGFDEAYLARLSMGIDGCIGAFYNIAPGAAIRLLEAYKKGDMETARLEQWRLHQIISINQTYSTGLVCREYMEFVGLDLGPPRLPIMPVSDVNKLAMKKELTEVGFFYWYSK